MTAQQEQAVLITGICGRLGQLLARTIHRTQPVIGIDRRRFDKWPADIIHHCVDLRRKKTQDVFRNRQISAVVHLGVMHNPRASSKEHHSWNVVGFQKITDYVVKYKIKKLVLLSSANVYGPHADNPQFLTEESPLLGAQSFSEIRDLVEIDMIGQSFFWRCAETETVILRPCHILGMVRNAASNYFRMKRPVTLLGYDPMVQVIHERDVVQAITLALRPGVRGLFNLKGSGEAPLSKMLQMLERRPLPIPSPVAKPLFTRLWRAHVSSFPAPEVDYLRYACMVDDSKARSELGHAPRHNLLETLRSVEEE